MNLRFLLLLLTAVVIEVWGQTVTQTVHLNESIPSETKTLIPLLNESIPSETKTLIPLPTEVPETPLPFIEGNSPYEWLGIGLNVLIIVVLLFSSCWIVGRYRTESSGDIGTNLLLTLPPISVCELRRLLTTDLRQIVPTAREAKILAAKPHLRSLPKSLLCWRRTQLGAAVVFYSVAFALSSSIVYSHETIATHVSEDRSLSDFAVLRKHFKHQMLDMIPFTQSVLSVSFYLFAMFRWQDLSHSQFLTITGFTVTFFIPFVFFMIPWMEIDSPQRMVQDMCRAIAEVLPISTDDGVILTHTHICDNSADKIGEMFEHHLRLIGVENGDLILVLMGIVLKYLVYVPTVISAFLAMKSLAPGVLGILMGLQSGLSLSKLALPGARLTTWLLVLLQAAAVPIIMFLCAVILIVVGTYPTTFTAICMTMSASLFIIFHNKLLETNSFDASIRIVRRLNRISLVLKVIAVGCLVLGIFTASQILALKAEGIAVIKNALTPIAIARVSVSFLAGFFSSKVVFTDIVLRIIIGTYIACINEDSKEDRVEILRDLLFVSSALKEYESKFNLEPLDREMNDLGKQAVGEAPMNSISFSSCAPSEIMDSPHQVVHPPCESGSRDVNQVDSPRQADSPHLVVDQKDSEQMDSPRQADSPHLVVDQKDSEQMDSPRQTDSLHLIMDQMDSPRDSQVMDPPRKTDPPKLSPLQVPSHSRSQAGTSTQANALAASPKSAQEIDSQRNTSSNSPPQELIQQKGVKPAELPVENGEDTEMKSI